MTTKKDVAEFMLNQLKSKNRIYQENIVYEIKKTFGEEFVYINENGNLAIDKGILKEFRNLTKNSVVWDRGDFAWRFRKESDPNNSRQVDS
jgi:hypothetical protein